MRRIVSRFLLAFYALNVAFSWIHFAVLPHVIDGTAQVTHHYPTDERQAPDNALAPRHDRSHAAHTDECRVMEFFSQQSGLVETMIASVSDLSIEPANLSPISHDIVLNDLFRIAPKQSPPRIV